MDLVRVRCPTCGETDATPELVSPAQLTDRREEFRFVRCARCSLVRLDPRPPEAALGEWYDDYVLHRGPAAWGRYARLVERAQRATDRRRVARVVRARLLASRPRVLDLGCGRPTFLEALREETGAHGVGIDFSDEGWRHESAAFAELELHRGVLADIPLEGPFDAITLWHALEHEPRPVETLERLRALAAPGAALIVEVPDGASWSRRLHGRHWGGLHTPRHTVVFEPATLARTLERAGWKLERLDRYGTLDPFVLWWLGRRARERRALPGDLGPMFPAFVAARALATPLLALQRFLPLGVMTALARPR